MARSALILWTQSEFAEACVQAEHHLPEQKVSKGIQTVFFHQIQRADDVSEALAHLGLFDVPISVDVQVLIRSNAR